MCTIASERNIMNITLVEIDKGNWEDCARLQVSKEQSFFLPANAYTIAESKFNNRIKILGISRGCKMIGFAAYVLDEDSDMNLTRFMIDQRFQGKGYGSKALDLLMARIKIEAVKGEVWLSLHPNNQIAVKLYTTYGFQETITGYETEDELFFRYAFDM